MPTSDQWIGAPPLEPKAQWDEVHKAWVHLDWDEVPATAAGDGGKEDVEKEEEKAEGGESGSVQTGFATAWAEAFGWNGALATVAKIPSLLNGRFDQLYVAAPLVTK